MYEFHTRHEIKAQRGQGHRYEHGRGFHTE
jgi:hypothetical protein